MFIFVIQTLRKKWNEIYMKQLAGGKHMEYDCFSKTLKFEMNKFESIQGKQRGDTNQQHVSE
jgi:hypothetical protein